MAPVAKGPVRQFLRVEGEMATLVQEEVLQEVPLAALERKMVELAPEVKKLPKLITPALPTGTRFYARDGQYEVYVIEQPPRKRALLTGASERLGGLHGGAGGYNTGWFEKERREQYAMPYVIFAVTTKFGATSIDAAGVRPFFSLEPLRSVEDHLKVACLPNLDANGVFCVATTANGKGSNTCEAVEDAIANFWGSRFTYEFSVHFPGDDGGRGEAASRRDGADHGKGFRKWAEMTKQKGDLAGLSIGWEDSRWKVSDLLSRKVTQW